MSCLETETINRLVPEDIVFEMILTTVDSEGRANAAPVGVVRRADRLYVDLACGTTSLENLMQNSLGALNILQDPLIFAKAAFDQISADVFDRGLGWEVPTVNGAAASILVSLASQEPLVRNDELGTTSFQRLGFRPLKAVIPGLPAAYTRRFGAALEVIIAVTKAAIAVERGHRHVIPAIQETVRRNLAVAGRTGTDRRTEQALDLCVQQLAHITDKERRRGHGARA